VARVRAFAPKSGQNMANVNKVHTPGQVETGQAPDADGEEMISVPKSVMTDVLHRLNAVEARAASPADRVAAHSALPDQSEVDPAKIERAVLTKQGWVIPLANPVNAGKV
jgi:hypothetical protein